MSALRLCILSAFMMAVGLETWAQPSSLVVFDEVKEDFVLYINGTKVNNIPTQHLRVTDLKAAHYKVEAQFVNLALPNQVMEIQISPGRETSYALMRLPNTNGPLSFHFLSEYSTGYFPIAPQSAMAIAYVGSSASQPQVVTPIVVPTPIPSDPKVIVNPVVVEPVRPNPLPGYTGAIGCPYPMDPIQFEEAKQSIASKSFSDTKMQLAKQVTRSNCLLTRQISEFMGLFSFESQKLEFAKFAFDFTYDQGNYYKINDAFGFESSIRDLEKYLQEK